ncbi:TRAP transporter small permease [Martelella soudanensis]|uniref:TRAP transporter small permease n=1 Tax=unclassified Martelella TaxID=2629616 RepID=UPI0015DDF445|nr:MULTISPECIES: TRAP transporter small permease [unclassified Martelella]
MRSKPLKIAVLGLRIFCGVMLVSMMMLTIVDVVGRYLMNRPLIGATEMTELLLAAIIFVGLPAASLDDEHITVDFISARTPLSVEPFRRALIAVVSAVVLGVVCWRLWIVGDNLSSYGAVTDSLDIPVAPVAYLTSVLTGIAMLITLLVGFAPPRRSKHVLDQDKTL